ncbi:hypothetical protein ACM66T_10055 [Sulfurimonas sp. ST-25]|uniref:hypothetical protein n=1 Tax=Sulfurimonas sp. ST-25 TaxID=3400151 RepID=UPI003A8AE77D
MNKAVRALIEGYVTSGIAPHSVRIGKHIRLVGEVDEQRCYAELLQMYGGWMFEDGAA